MGQKIELDMANAMDLKVSQVYRPSGRGYEMRFYDHRRRDAVTAEIARWYDGRCQNMSVTAIRQSYKPR